MTYIALYALLHIACSILVFGWLYSYFTKEFLLLCDENGKREDNFGICLVGSLFGPLTLPACLIVCGFKHGWSLTPRATRQDWERKYGKNHPYLTCQFANS